MKDEPRIHSPVTRAMIEYAGLKGADRDVLCREAGIPTATVAGPEPRFTPSQLAAVWRHASELLDDEYIGLHVGAFARLNALGVVSYLVQSSRSLGEAIDCASRYTGLAGNVLDLSHRSERTLWHLTFRLQQPVPRSESFVLHQIADATVSIIALALDVLSNRDVRPRHVRFSHGEPAGAAEYERIFKIKPEFDQTEDALVYDRVVKDFPVTFSNPDVHHVFERHATALLRALEEQDDVSGKVKSILLNRIRDVHLSEREVAEALFMSPRSLQRRLAREGATYRDLVDEVRCDLACDYLVRLGTSVTDTALLVGLSSPSALIRSFRRWRGMSPKEYQDRHRRGT